MVQCFVMRWHCGKVQEYKAYVNIDDIVSDEQSLNAVTVVVDYSEEKDKPGILNWRLDSLKCIPVCIALNKINDFFKRIVQSKIYFWYLKEEHNLSILVKVALNSQVPFLRYWQLKFPHFLPKWTSSKQMWCHGCTMAKICFVFLYIWLCCFDLELDTVASLPAGDLKSMEYSCLWLSHITSVANVKGTNLGANFKEKQNIFLSLCIDDITPVCLKLTFGTKGTNFNYQYLENET